MYPLPEPISNILDPVFNLELNYSKQYACICGADIVAE